MVEHDGGQAAMPTADTAGGAARPIEGAAPIGTGEPPGIAWRGRRPHGWRLRDWRLQNWRIRWRVLGLVVIPTVAAMLLGTLRIQAAQATSDAAARIEQLSVLGADITSLAEAMEDERDLTAGYVATRQSGQAKLSSTLLAQLEQQYAVTNARLLAVREDASGIGSTYALVARTDLASALASLSAVTELRALAHTQMAPLPLVTHYTNVIETLLEFDNDIAAGTSSAQLAQTVSSLAALTQVEEQASQQRAILYASLFAGSFQGGALSALTGAQSSQASDLAAFQQETANLPAFIPGSGLSAVITQSQQFNNTFTGPAIDAAVAIEVDAIVSGQDSQPLSGNSPQAWFSDMSFTLGALRTVESDELASISAQAGALRQGAVKSRELTELIALALLVLVLLGTIVMARSLIIPLRILRTDALDIAGRRLPDMVRQLSEAEGVGGDLAIEPIGIDSTDEVGEVARAFDQVHSEAIRLAGEEALLRANLNAMFVNLSRRSQTLVERQLDIIDLLEQSEQDPDRLSSLFRLDHLATRMRRNSENLLVLAGYEAPRKWTESVPLVDILRASVSEIEQYDRISLNAQPGIVVAGRAANDVVHLVAELVENATAFSSEDTQVRVASQLLTSGGALIEITDEGLGIGAEELAYANWRLDNPPVIDVAVSRRMGLFVVGRLAARHGIRVRLRPVTRGGLSALIWLPGPIATFESAPPLAGLRRRTEVRSFHPFFRPGRRSTPAMTMQAAPARQPSLPAEPVPASPQDQPAEPSEPRVTQSGLPIRQPQPAAQARPASASKEHPDAPPQPAETAGQEDLALGVEVPGTPGARLPIYDSVESDWFRHSGKLILPRQPSAGSWTSPADEGFRAAQAAASPTTGTATAAGLPRRVPSANLIPGSVGEPSREAHEQQEAGQLAGVRSASGWPASQEAAGSPPPPPASVPRRPEQVRSRLAGLQRGARRGRTDAPWNFGADEG
jgi:Nitrate and nitrite sensing/Histidine kinase-, DNA gyrase B-, and HSP90-like ATPase